MVIAVADGEIHDKARRDVLSRGAQFSEVDRGVLKVPPATVRHASEDHWCRQSDKANPGLAVGQLIRLGWWFRARPRCQVACESAEADAGCSRRNATCKKVEIKPVEGYGVVPRRGQHSFRCGPRGGNAERKIHPVPEPRIFGAPRPPPHQPPTP